MQFLHFLKPRLLSACLPHCRHWHSNWLFPFIIAVSVLFLALSTETTAVIFFSADAQDRRKRPRKWCTTYSSHFAKRHSSVDSVVRGNNREWQATARNASSSVVPFSESRLKSHVLSSAQTRKTCSLWHGSSRVLLKKKGRGPGRWLSSGEALLFFQRTSFISNI